jgi:hypothetical protein
VARRAARRATGGCRCARWQVRGREAAGAGARASRPARDGGRRPGRGCPRTASRRRVDRWARSLPWWRWRSWRCRSCWAGPSRPPPPPPLEVAVRLADGPFSGSQGGVLLLPLDVEVRGPDVRLGEVVLWAEPVRQQTTLSGATRFTPGRTGRLLVLVQPDCSLLAPSQGLALQLTADLELLGPDGSGCDSARPGGRARGGGPGAAWPRPRRLSRPACNAQRAPARDLRRARAPRRRGPSPGSALRPARPGRAGGARRWAGRGRRAGRAAGCR